MYVQSEFKMEAVVIGRWRAGDDGFRADGRGYTVGSRKHIQTADEIGDHRRDEKFGDSSER